MSWQQSQGAKDVPTISDERLELRLLSDPTEPTTLRNVIAAGRPYTFTGGRPQVESAPLGPALRLATGVTADLGALGDIESR